MAITSAFQADDAGSIPATRSKVEFKVDKIKSKAMNDNNKTLVIGVKDEIISLKLRNYNRENNNDAKYRIIDKTEWENDDGSTSEMLLKRIDTFLKKNTIEVDQLLKVETTIDRNQKYTLFRIIKIVTKTINYCLRST